MDDQPPPPRSSYKGSALSLMVELLAGPLVGAAVADKLSEKNWGNLVLALDPSLLGDKETIQARMQASGRCTPLHFVKKSMDGNKQARTQARGR